MGKLHRGTRPLGQGLQPPVPLPGDLLERRSPHRGMRVTEQGHPRRRSGVARHALRLSGVQKIVLAAVEETSALYSAAARASGGSRFDGTALRSAAAATAACTCANAFCTAAS